ncbi:hypothetical protein [Halovivax asiaticus]|uniref:hypothetical protein n=1 Tax=Halovivax asiaticus TaxID=332953 RepID=UPI001F4D194A|nr:hypothetical protein [Halovivax asiaticus]
MATLLAATAGGCLRDRIGSGGGPAGPDEPGDNESAGGPTGDNESADPESGSNKSADGTPGTDASGDDPAVTLTDYAVSDHVVDPTVGRGAETDVWGVYLASRSAAETAFAAATGPDADAVRAFVAETAFDDGETLVYVQALAPQTCYALELDDEPTVDEAGRPQLPLAVTRTAPPEDLCGEAITPVSVLVRLVFAQVVPDTLSVAVSGRGEQPTQLELQASR